MTTPEICNLRIVRLSDAAESPNSYYLDSSQVDLMVDFEAGVDPDSDAACEFVRSFTLDLHLRDEPPVEPSPSSSS